MWVIFDQDEPGSRSVHVGYAPKAYLKAGVPTGRGRVETCHATRLNILFQPDEITGRADQFRQKSLNGAALNSL